MVLQREQHALAFSRDAAEARGDAAQAQAADAARAHAQALQGLAGERTRMPRL